MKPLSLKACLWGFLVFTSLFFASCCCRYPGGGGWRSRDFQYGTFKFAERPDQIYLKPSFKTFLKANPACTVVLRSPAYTDAVSKEESFNNRSAYFAFEKVLLENNFKVNDRSLFEKEFEKSGVEKLKTDLIIEMVDYKPVQYYTNKVVPRDGNYGKEITLNRFYYFQGAKAEFKIVHIQSNEVVATFVLNYSPCTKGCQVRYTKSGYWEEIEYDARFVSKGVESVELSQNENVFIDLATRVVKELKKAAE